MKLKKWLGMLLSLMMVIAIGVGISACGTKTVDETVTITWYDGTTVLQTTEDHLKDHVIKESEKPTLPVKDGYTFENWFADAAGKTVFDFTKPVSEDISIYAIWKKNDPQKPAHSHEYGAWTVQKKPTMTETGTAQRTCTSKDCDNSASKTQEKVLPKLSETAKYSVVHTTPATCTVKGVDTYTLKEETSISFTAEVAATGHKMQEHAAVAATCEKAGNVKYYTCEHEAPTVYYKDAQGNEKLETIVDPQKQHTFGGQWYHDTTDHWQLCTMCGKAQSEHRAHDTNGKDGVEGACSVCGYKAEEQPTPHTHNYGAWVIDEPTMSEDGTATKTCPDCGEEEPDHTVTVTLPALSTEGAYDVETTPAECEKAGSNKYTFKQDQTITFTVEIPATGHTYGQPTWNWESKQGGGYTVTATFKCEKNDKTETKEAVVTSREENIGCTKNTVYTATVEFGDKQYTQDKTDILEGQHTFDEAVQAKQPTCTEKGNVWYQHCSACNKDFDENGNDITGHTEIAATGHDMVKHEAKPATCQAAGTVEYYTCKHEADTVYYKNIEGTETLETIEDPIKDHDYTGAPWQHDATGHWQVCTMCKEHESDHQPHNTNGDNGACSVCGYKAEGPVHQHNYGPWNVTKPTAENKGSAERTCTAQDCPDEQKGKQTVELPVLGDAGYTKGTDSATCTTPGTQSYTYTSEYGEITFTVETPVKAHNYGNRIEQQDATCTKPGVKAHYQCDDCEQYFLEVDGNPAATPADEEDLKIEATGHSYPDAWQIQQPTMDTVGSATKTCTKCTDEEESHTITVELPKLSEEEKYTGGVAHNSEPNCTTEGSYTFTLNNENGNIIFTATIPAKGHTYEWKYNEETHWQYCDVCKTTTDPAPHKLDANHQCEECKAQKYCATFAKGTFTGDWNVEPIIRLPGAQITLPTPPAFSGHSFEGWKEGTAGATHNANTEYTLNGNVTFTAQWKEVQEKDTNVYYLVGKGKGTLKGNNWNGDDASRTLPRAAIEGNADRFELVDVKLYVGDEFKFHTLKTSSYNGEWFGPKAFRLGGETYGTNYVKSGDGDDPNYVVTQNGTYTITLYTVGDRHVDIQRTGDAPDYKEWDMYLIGSIGASPETWMGTAMETYHMTRSDATKTWSIKVTLTSDNVPETWDDTDALANKGKVALKVLNNGGYGEDYGIGTEKNKNIWLEPGIYEITFSESNQSITTTRFYTLTYTFEDYAEGQVPKAEEVPANVQHGLPKLDDRVGYEFLGWFDGSNKVANPNSYIVTKNVTLTAKWQKISYTVKYEAGKAGTMTYTPVTQTVQIGGTIELSNPTAKGYNFAGWEIKGQSYSGTVTVDESFLKADGVVGTENTITFTATWTAKTYKVEFKHDPAVDAGASQPEGMPTKAELTVEDGKNTLTLTTPTRKGYDFVEWQFNGSKYAQDAFTLTQENVPEDGTITFTAKWQLKSYTVNFDGVKEGAVVTSSSTTVQLGGQITLAEATCTGYTFDKWEYNGRTYEKNASFTLKEADLPDGGTITFTAKWMANKYTITFDKNAPAEELADQIQGEANDIPNVTLDNADITLPTLTLSNYTFNGWALDKDNGEGMKGTTTLTADMITKAVDGAITLYAKWTEFGKVTASFDLGFNADPAQKAPEDITVHEGSSITFPEINVTRTGYTFAGWKGTTNEGLYQAQATLNLNASETFTAQWTAITYTVKFTGEGVSVDEKKITLDDAAENLFPTAGTMQRTGYTFTAWTLQGKDDLTFDKLSEALIENAEPIAPDNTITLVAKWTAKEYTVAFKTEGEGEGVTNMPTHSGVVTVEDGHNTITLSVPLRTGYTFKGWKLEGYSGSEFFSKNGDTFTLTAVILGKVTFSEGEGKLVFTAQWEINKYTVTFENGGYGTAPEAVQNVGWGTKFELGTYAIADDETAHKHFLGWKLQETEDTRLVTSVEVKSDITLVAVWENMIAVTFKVDGSENTTVYVVNGQPIPENKYPQNPSKKGYRFDGWYNEDTPYVKETPVKEALTLTAHFVEQVTVKFQKHTYTNGKENSAVTSVGTVTLDKDATYNTGNPQGTWPANPTNTGYKFDGWYLGGTKYEKTTPITASITLTAKFVVDESKLNEDLYALVGMQNTGIKGQSWVETESTGNGYAGSQEGVDYNAFTRVEDEIYVSGTTVYTIYRKTVYMQSGNKFKIIRKTNGVWNYNFEINWTHVTPLDGASGLSDAKDSNNILVSTAGWYTFEFYISKSNSGEFFAMDGNTLTKWKLNYKTESKSAPSHEPYVRGGFNGWLNDEASRLEWAYGIAQEKPEIKKYKMTFDSATSSYILDVEVTSVANGGGEFKIFDWYDGQWYGTKGNAEDSGNIVSITSEGTWRITWTVGGIPKATKIETYNYTYALGSCGGTEYAGHTKVPDSGHVVTTESCTITLPDAPVWAGYTFTGWKVGENGQTYGAGKQVTLTKSVTITAQWKLTDYTVTYELNGGTGNVEDPKTDYHMGDEVTISDIEPTRTGYTFTGWKVAGDTNNYKKDGDDNLNTYTMKAANVTFTAQWKAKEYTVVYSAGDDVSIEGNLPTDTTKYTLEDGKTTITVSATEPTRTGYTFTGWQIKDYAQSETYKTGTEKTSFELTKELIKALKDEQEITLVAQWKVNSYEVKFDDGVVDEEIQVPDKASADYGSQYTIPDEEPTRTGYTFTGWKVEGDENNYKKDGEDNKQSYTMKAEAVTFTAQWEAIKYTLKFTTEFNKEKAADIGNVTIGQTSELPQLSETGYTFGGWTLNDTTYSGEQKFTLTQELIEKQGIVVENAITFTAVWTSIKYNVTFATETVVGNPQLPTTPTELALDGKTEVELEALTLSGYTFDGWYVGNEKLTANEEGKYTFTLTAEEIKKDGVVVEGTITFTAHWKAKEYTVVFEKNASDDVTGMPTEGQKVTVEEGHNTITFSTPSRTGYTFGGWQRANGDIVKPEAFETYKFDATQVPVSGEEVKFTAQWTEKGKVTASFSLGFDTEESAPASQTVLPGYNITFPAVGVTRTGYKFTGWKGSDETIHQPQETMALNASETFIAQWEAIKYTIELKSQGSTINTLSEVTLENAAMEGKTFTDPAARTGYKFDGWKLDGKDGLYEKLTPELITAAALVDDNTTITLTAQWTALTYTVVYDDGVANEAIDVPTDQAVYTLEKASKTITVKAMDETRKGYTFAGWKIKGYEQSGTYKADSETASFELSEAIINTLGSEQKITLEAQWTAINYTVEFAHEPVLAEGEAADVATMPEVQGTLTVESGSNTFDLTTPTRPGYTFDGWEYNNESVSGTFTLTQQNVPEGDKITVTAKWRLNNYKLTFNDIAHEQTAGEIDNVTITSGSHDLPEIDVVGYDFEGWQYNGETYTTFTLTKDLIPAEGETIEFTAKWKASTYNVTFVQSNDYETQQLLPAAMTITTEGTISLTALHDDAEWHFLGWEFKGVTYTEGMGFTLTLGMLGEDDKDFSVTFTAQWEKKIKVTFEYNDKSETKYFVKGYTLTEGDYPTDTEKDGFRFGGWLTEDSEPYTASALTKDITLKAKYVKLIKVTYFDEYNDEIAAKAETIDEKTPATKTAEASDKKGYTFVNVSGTTSKKDIWMSEWYTDEDRTQKYAGGAISENTQLYRKWVEDTASTLTSVLSKNYLIVGSSNGGSALQFTADDYDVGRFRKDASLTKHYIYTVTVAMKKDDFFRFKYATGTWSNDSQIGWSQVSGKWNSHFTQYISPTGTGSDNNIKVAQDGIYKFILAVINGNVSVAYERVCDLNTAIQEGYYLVGSMTGWGNYGCTPIYLGPTSTQNGKSLTVDVEIATKDLGEDDKGPLLYATAKVVVGHTYADGFFYISSWDVITSEEEDTNFHFPSGTGSFHVTFTVSNVATHKGTLKAQKIITYKYSFSLGDAAGQIEYDLPESGSVNSLEKMTVTMPETDPVWAGHRFLGWQVNGAGTYYQAKQDVEIKADNTVIKAAWIEQYNVSFSANEGDDGAMPKGGLADKGSYTIPAGEPTRTGYTFAGWQVDDDETLYKHNDATHGTYNLTGEVTFKAAWTPITYDITYVNEQGAVSGQKLSLESAEKFTVPTAKGYDFGGWKLQGHVGDSDPTYEELTLDLIKAAALEEGNTTITLVAQWTKRTYTVVFADAEVTEEYKNKTVQLEGTIALPQTLSREGFNFTGWQIGGAHVGAGDTTATVTLDMIADEATDTITVTAQWAEIGNVSITFEANANGDNVNGMPESTSAKANETYSIPSDTPTRKGYTFTGWKVLADNDEKVYMNGGENSTYKFKEDQQSVTFTAQWSAKSYIVTFEDSRSKVQTSSATVSLEQPLTLEALTDEGWNFEGWTYNGKEYTGSFTLTLDMITEPEESFTLTFTAKWTREITVNWHVLGGDEEVHTAKYYSGEAISKENTSPYNPQKEGYVLDGWYKSDDYTGVKYNFTEVLEDTSATLDLYARFYKEQVTVKFIIETKYSTSSTVTGTDTEEVKSVSIAGLTGTTTAPTTPTKKYMTFAGWKTKDGATTFAAGMHFLDDTTFYANWTEASNASYEKDSNYYHVYGHYSYNTDSSMNKISDWKASSMTLTLKRDESYNQHNVNYIDLTLYYGDVFQILHSETKTGSDGLQMGFAFLNNAGNAFWSTDENGWQANIILSAGMDGKFHFTLATDPTKKTGTQFTPQTGAILEYTREAVTPKEDEYTACIIGKGTKFGNWVQSDANKKYHLYRDSSYGDHAYSTYVYFEYGDTFKGLCESKWYGRASDIWDSNSWSDFPEKQDGDDNLVYRGSGGWYRVELYYEVRGGGTSTNDSTDFIVGGSKAFLRIYKI